MCLPDFQEFKQINEDSPLIGYRTWKNLIDKNSIVLMSEHRNYAWKTPIDGPHIVTSSNSGLYAYNNYNYYYNYNYNNYNYYNYYNNYNNYNYNYNLQGIIHQWGKTAIHKTGQRSEYARILTLFTIRELDATGPKTFLDWIKMFNEKINKIAEYYQCETKHWQDFLDESK